MVLDFSSSLNCVQSKQITVSGVESGWEGFYSLSACAVWIASQLLSYFWYYSKLKPEAGSPFPEFNFGLKARHCWNSSLCSRDFPNVPPVIYSRVPTYYMQNNVMKTEWIGQKQLTKISSISCYNSRSTDSDVIRLLVDCFGISLPLKIATLRAQRIVEGVSRLLK